MFGLLLCWLGCFDFGYSANAAAQDADKGPEWLSVTGEMRARYESLDGQFRAGGAGGDQLLLFRSLLKVDVDTGPLTLGAELQDSRTYLGDAGTPLSNGIANPLDILQLYAKADNLPGLLGSGSSSTLTAGRQTISIGSKRQIERIEFANVIKSYTGLTSETTNERGDSLNLFYAVPLARFPNDRPDLDNNTLSGDEEEWGRRIWGIHYRRADIAPTFAPDLWGELFIYGLNESDRTDVQTPDRDYFAPGFRLYRKPARSQWDIDLEAAQRTGHRSSSATDPTRLDVKVAMMSFALGYTFDAPWQPRIAFEYYYASGDDDPNDLIFGQHERLFGSRRSDLNNTSIHGPLTPANLSAPGFRVEVKPNERWDARLYYHAAHLASTTDEWVIAKLRDPSGQSGRFIGHTLDGRVRYWVVPDQLRFEMGGSALLFGHFAKNVPGGPKGDGTLFGYSQLTFSF